VRILTSLAILLLLQACKHPLAIVGEGDIVDLNGTGYGCTYEQFAAGGSACDLDVQGDYLVNYQAVPRPGWKFVRWEGPCGHMSVAPNCMIETVAAWVAFWDQTYSHIAIPRTLAIFERGNVAPVADAGADQVLWEASTVTLDGSGSADADGYIASYSWSQTGGSSVVLSSDTEPSPIFTPPDDGSAQLLTFKLTVIDDEAVSHDDTVTIVLGFPARFQAEVHGPAVGTSITISDLRDPQVVYAETTTYAEADLTSLLGEGVWATLDDHLKLVLLGRFDFDTSEFDNTQLYLLTAVGGEDADADSDFQEDSAYAPINGLWHAIVTGAQLKDGATHVSALTEAIYLWLLPQLNALEYGQLAENISRAAKLLVADIDGNRLADHNDLVLWNRLIGETQFLGDSAVLTSLADSVVDDGSIETATELALALIQLAVQGDIDPESFFQEHIADDLLAAKCLNCHVDGGPSEHTRLVFVSEGSPDQDTLNQTILENFVTSIDGAQELILSKIQGGLSHGGSFVFGSSSQEWQNLQTFIALVQEGDAPVSTGAELAAFWDGISLASARQTLRRSALIVAGRLPTEAEVDLAESGDDGLRQTLRDMMSGDVFHDFLISGSNDRLHTDAFLNGLFMDLLDCCYGYYPVFVNKNFDAEITGDQDLIAEKDDWRNKVLKGFSRSPLELIAHVIENDLPYTEILTADYMMVNPQMAEALRSGVNFETDDSSEFLPGHNNGQILVGDDTVQEQTTNVGLNVMSHSGFIDYPEAGVLNTQAFLNRYPTTETNRNRARARWTYLHFLGVDIEKSAPRTTDPVALADNNNPTLNNPACTVCHQLHDPVAGAFQNYGNFGWFRDAWNGADALPDTYKHPEWFGGDPESTLYQPGDTWYRDMRAAGIEGAVAPSPENSLQWLAQEIAGDLRFTTATINFWWPAVMGAATLEAPESPVDQNYAAQLRAYEVQRADIQELADAFVDSGYKVKDLLVEMMMSPWFRANSIDAVLASGRDKELYEAGTRRLLTPEELERKTEYLMGFLWNGWDDEYQVDGVYSALGDRLRLYYGGIDSLGVKERARELTTLMYHTALRQSLEMACSVVVDDFSRPDEERQVFAGIDRHQTPLSEALLEFDVVEDNIADAGTYTLPVTLSAGDKTIRVSFLEDFYVENVYDRNLFVDRIDIRNSQGLILQTIEVEDLADIAGASYTQYDDGGDSGGSWYDDWQNGPGGGWIIWSTGNITFPLVVASDGEYRIEVVAWGEQHPDYVGPSMSVTINSNDPFGGSAGEQSIRQKLVELHSSFLGEELDANDAEIDASYQLLVETWQWRLETIMYEGSNDYLEESCNGHPDWDDEWWQSDWTRHWGDPERMMGTWTTVMTYLMTDYNYLHE
jgi:hypothetical protein